jgi:D-beta-D-heptose 7-phosphate kinase/D-beta-D-heptose 1-phosphate adenosyltransferase
MSDHAVDRDEDIVNAAKALVEKYQFTGVLVKMGKRGMVAVYRDEHTISTSYQTASSNKAVDVTGAGDTAVSAFAIAIAAGATIERALSFTSIACKVAVENFKTSAVSIASIFDEWCSHHSDLQARICDRAVAKLVTDSWQRSGLQVVFTNGCFDLLHEGHIEVLSASARLGDRLVVGVNADESVTRLKGKGRPVNSLDRRALLLAAMRPVSMVLPFEEDTPYNVISAIRPSVLVKGSDYARNAIVGAEFVSSYGGKVETVPLVAQASSSLIIDKILEIANL